MGSYDEVNFEYPCPSCKKTVTGFQTKDLSCDFEKVEYWECDNFYTACDWCGTWIEFNLNRKPLKIPIEHYEMEFRPCEKVESSLIRGKGGRDR